MGDALIQQFIATDKHYVVVGLGKTGLSCARYLAAKGQCFKVVDSRSQPPLLGAFKEDFPHVECLLGFNEEFNQEFNEEFLKNVDELIVSPGVSLQEPAIAAAMAKGLSVIGDIDLFRREVSKPIVAITGSNGKSTVTSLVGEMARNAGSKVAVAGNIGLPVLELLDESGNETEEFDLYVLELSSFQLERLQDLDAEVAVVLNVSADHLDRYADLASYHRAKQRVFRGVRQVVVNRADPLSEPPLMRGLKRCSYGLDLADQHDFGIIEKHGRQFLALGSQALLAVSELKIAGQHNIENALASLALGQVINLPMNAMLNALRNYGGLAHRCQYVASVSGVDFYDDSKGTNVGATMSAIEGLGKVSEGKIILIAGGEDKGADFSPLGKVVQGYSKCVVLIGKAAPVLFDTFHDIVQVIRAETMDGAVASALSVAEAGDVILLSPACASFDMFENFEQRGDAFIAAVKRLTDTEHKS